MRGEKIKKCGSKREILSSPPLLNQSRLVKTPWPLRTLEYASTAGYRFISQFYWSSATVKWKAVEKKGMLSKRDIKQALLLGNLAYG